VPDRKSHEPRQWHRRPRAGSGVEVGGGAAAKTSISPRDPVTVCVPGSAKRVRGWGGGCARARVCVCVWRCGGAVRRRRRRSGGGGGATRTRAGRSEAETGNGVRRCSGAAGGGRARLGHRRTAPPPRLRPRTRVRPGPSRFLSRDFFLSRERRRVDLRPDSERVCGSGRSIGPRRLSSSLVILAILSFALALPPNVLR
jgi:hypothetical protein